jgi:4,4'-diaponeurosporenoate glycosyltransferase
MFHQLVIGDLIRIGFLLIGFYLMFKVPSFHKLKDIKPRDLSKLSIIIPARNEEKRITPLLKSLRKQKTQRFEIIVVDDESTDKTAEIAKSFGATVIQSKPLPKGWRGKSWASHQGALAAKGDVFVFLDADTSLTENGLNRIIERFFEEETPLSVQPYHQMKRPYEQLSIFFNLIVMMSTNSDTPFQHKLKPHVFFGPCQVIKKEDYMKIGGHETVKGSILEDIAIGKRFMENNQKIRSMAGRGAISFRMYPDGVRDIFLGWSKNFATGAFSIGVLNLLLISLWISGVFGSATVFFLDITSLDPIKIGLYLLFGLQVYWMARRIGNFSPFVIILYPIHVLFFVFVFINSLVRTLFVKKVSWKGRDISMKKGE